MTGIPTHTVLSQILSIMFLELKEISYTIYYN